MQVETGQGLAAPGSNWLKSKMYREAYLLLKERSMDK